MGRAPRLRFVGTEDSTGAFISVEMRQTHLTDDDLSETLILGRAGHEQRYIAAASLAKLEDSLGLYGKPSSLMRNGNIVFEQYYNWHVLAKDSYPMWRVFPKAILSALIGIAMQHRIYHHSWKIGYSEHLPKYFAEVGDQRLLDLTIRDMLTMTHGLDLAGKPDSDRAADFEAAIGLL